MSASLKYSALSAVVSVPAEVMFAVRTSRSLIIAFLVGCLLGLALVVLEMHMVASFPSGVGVSAGGAPMSVGATASGVGDVLCLILNLGIRVGGMLGVGVGPSPGFPSVWLCLGWGRVGLW